MSSSTLQPLRIFLAHAQEDKNQVFELYDRLKAKGYQPWLDKKDLLPGQRWREEIPKAIRSSDIFLACLSQTSVAKQGYVQREFRMALNACADRPSGTIYLIPLRFDDCQIPELRQEEYGISLLDYQWLDYFESDGFDRLVQSIDLHFPGRAVSETPPQGRDFPVDLGNGVTLELVKIPGGTFLMGFPEYEPERFNNGGPQHKVTVPTFYMGKYPVTQAQYQAIMGKNPSNFKGDDRPVEQVSWDDAVEFCARLTRETGNEYRLPSEAEWEYACRAGTTTAYSFGDSISKDQANFGKNVGSTSEVGSYRSNAFGLFDMHGNVWEWCQDIGHGTYEGAPVDGSAWMTGGVQVRRVLRGGSWNSDPWSCRSAYRSSGTRVYRFYIIGFRVVSVAPRTL